MNLYRKSRSGKEVVAIGLGACLLALVALAIIVAGWAFVLMLAWNVVMPQVFGLIPLDYPKALALTVMTAIILGFARGSVTVQK